MALYQYSVRLRSTNFERALLFRGSFCLYYLQVSLDETEFLHHCIKERRGLIFRGFFFFYFVIFQRSGHLEES